MPPSPDRWAPKLAGARAVDRNHVDVVFSEKMDKTAAANRQSYVVVDEGNDTLEVHSAQLLPDGQTVRLTTGSQGTGTYSVDVALVTDAAGNELRPGSTKSFKGSADRDTTRPLVKSIYPADGGIGVPADTAVRVLFSETMDTTSTSLRTGALIVLPPPADSALTWNMEMSAFDLPVLALTSSKSFIHVTRGCRDYGGNRLRMPEKSVFTTEDSMPGGIISGVLDAPTGSSPILSSVGVFDTLWTPLLLDYARDSTGSFTFTHLSDGKYRVAAARDRDGDDEFDMRGMSEELSIESGEPLEGVKVHLVAEGDLDERAESALLNFYTMNLREDEVR